MRFFSLLTGSKFCTRPEVFQRVVSLEETRRAIVRKGNRRALYPSSFPQENKEERVKLPPLQEKKEALSKSGVTQDLFPGEPPGGPPVPKMRDECGLIQGRE